jgi:hypothetical protein
VERFEMPRARWALPILAPLAPRGGAVELSDETVEVHLGAIGRASIPLELIDRASMMNWPWWAGLGVRIGRGMVGFVAKSGPAVLLELAAPIDVRAPLRWSTQRIVVRVSDPEAFLRALAQRRGALPRG